jgi:hypothetical protein
MAINIHESLNNHISNKRLNHQNSSRLASKRNNLTGLDLHYILTKLHTKYQDRDTTAAAAEAANCVARQGGL